MHETCHSTLFASIYWLSIGITCFCFVTRRSSCACRDNRHSLCQQHTKGLFARREAGYMNDIEMTDKKQRKQNCMNVYIQN